ncbi:transposase family protein [Streptomyces hirsutus]|uniref:transposase family protein n=1 Tax=Streptomyces hirsutus TaxID=35620 RepID=UPI002DD8F633|nr:transposase family protein [Streptomyces hirsutus]
MKTKQARAAMSHPAFCGLSRHRLGELVAELAPRWVARCESGRHERREGDRRREAGAGPKYEPVFADRLLVTLIHLRTGLTHEALSVLYEVGSSTIGRAIREVRPLPADRGFAVPGRPGIRLRTLEDVFVYVAAEDVTLRIDGMETQVRRPHAGRPGPRPRRQATHPVQPEHRAGARPHNGLLNHLPAEPAGQHAPRSIAGQPVSVAGRTVIRAQLTRILETADADHVTVRGIPFALDDFAGAGSAMVHLGGPVPRLDRGARRSPVRPSLTVKPNWRISKTCSVV